MGGRRLVGWLLLGLVTALAAPADAQELRGVVVEVKDDLATGLAIRTLGAVRYDRELEIYSKNFNHLGHTLTVEGVASTWPGTDLAKLTAAVKAWAGQQKTKAPEALKAPDALQLSGGDPNAESLTGLQARLGALRTPQKEIEDLLAGYARAIETYVAEISAVEGLAEQALQAREAVAGPLSLAEAKALLPAQLKVSSKEVDLQGGAAGRETQQLAARVRNQWVQTDALYTKLKSAHQALQTAAATAPVALLQSQIERLEGSQLRPELAKVVAEWARSNAEFAAKWEATWTSLTDQHERLTKTAPGTPEGEQALKDLVAVVSELVRFANADPAQPRLVTTLAPEKTKGDDLTIKATARSRQDNAVVAEGSAKLAISGGLRVRLTSALVGTFGVADDDITIVQTPADPVAGTPATGRLLVDRVNFDFGDAQLVVFEPRQSREYCWGAAFGTNLLDGAARRYFVGPTFTYGRGDVRLTIPFGVVFGRVRGLANTINPAGNFAGVSESSLGRRDNQWKVGGYLGVGLGFEF